MTSAECLNIEWHFIVFIDINITTIESLMNQMYENKWFQPVSGGINRQRSPWVVWRGSLLENELSRRIHLPDMDCHSEDKKDTS